MTNKNEVRAICLSEQMKKFQLLATAFFLIIAMALTLLPERVAAQSYRFDTVAIEGNQRIGGDAILTYAGIARGETVTAGQLNDAYQRILASGLFESVTIEPRGSQLVINVVEYPTINRINFEGNARLKDDALAGFIKSKPRLVFNPTVAEQDAEIIADAYLENGRVAAKVTPRIIKRRDNRVDLVFEIFEGGITEIQRIGFVGNKNYSDNRLRRVLGTKQAGILRAFIKKDTFVESRVEFDKQLLRDFYLSRGYVDFRTTGVNAELSRERDGYFLTFNVQEGQQFRFGEITTVSEVEGLEAADFQEALRIRSGVVYSPSLVENSIARLERLAIQKGIDFVRVEPRISRNDRDLTLDVEFLLSKGPRIFVERIDIEGNATTLDQVVRRQFRVAEGDPFNPREIRESAERIRALGFFENADVQARQGSAADKVVVDVDVTEANTGSLSFGGTFSTDSGFGLAVTFSEKNFLGRGQFLGVTVSGAEDNTVYALNFREPAFLGRDVGFNMAIAYRETENQYAKYDTTSYRFSPGFSFPVSERGTLGLNYNISSMDMTIDPADTIGGIITSEASAGELVTSSLGYTYTYDSRRGGLNPNAGYLLQFGQEFAGLGGDTEFIKTTAKAIAQTKVLNEEITLRATLEGGAVNFASGTSSRSPDRFVLNNSVMRGFELNGMGPRERSADGSVDDALGGNFFAVARFEAEFPLGLPEEYGVRGGVFYDIGSVWGADTATATNPVLYEDFTTRQVVGVSLFWTTPVGPLRLNWSHALDKQEFDEDQTFNLSIFTEF